MLQGTILVLAMIFVATNLVVDLPQSAIDPRIRRTERCRGTAALARSLPSTTMPRQYCACAATGARSGYRLRHDPVTLFFGAIVLLIVLMAIFAPLVAPFDPYKESVIAATEADRLRGHWLGTDELGRDLLSRLIYGGRSSLLMGLMPVCIATVLGGFLGMLGGFAGGCVNTAIMRTMDVFYAFPSVLLAIAICGCDGRRHGERMVALSVVFIPPMCRVAETVTTQARSLDFVEAARASGAGTMHHRPPSCARQCAGPVFIYATSLVSGHHPARVGSVVSGPWREAAEAGLGPDAEHAAPVDLRAALSARCPA